MNINPIGEEVSKKVFEKYIKNFPRCHRSGYSNVDIYIHSWMGKEKWIGMFCSGKYYIIEKKKKKKKEKLNPDQVAFRKYINENYY